MKTVLGRQHRGSKQHRNKTARWKNVPLCGKQCGLEFRVAGTCGNVYVFRATTPSIEAVLPRQAVQLQIAGQNQSKCNECENILLASLGPVRVSPQRTLTQSRTALQLDPTSTERHHNVQTNLGPCSKQKRKERLKSAKIADEHRTQGRIKHELDKVGRNHHRRQFAAIEPMRQTLKTQTAARPLGNPDPAIWKTFPQIGNELHRNRENGHRVNRDRLTLRFRQRNR